MVSRSQAEQLDFPEADGFLDLSASRTVSPLDATLPSITTNPASADVTVGANATFSVSATPNDGTLTYQWYFDGRQISGATSATLTIPNAQLSSAGSYSVDVGSTALAPYWADSSAEAILTVWSANPTGTALPKYPSVYFNYAAIEVAYGAPVTLSLQGSTSAADSYQWYLNGVAISGATGSSYSIAALQLTDLGRYVVTISNSQETTAVPSEELILTGPSPTGPAISGVDFTATVQAGSPETFQVEATGTAPMTYQWYFNQVAISGATSPSYTIAAIEHANAGSYTIRIVNAFGIMTSQPAVVQVVDVPISITQQPVSMTVGEGNPASVSVTASGPQALAYQWYLNGSAIVGATSASYTIPSAEAKDSGSYYVAITDSDGTVTSQMASLEVSITPPTILSQPSSETVPLGGSASLVVAANGSNLQYQWSLNGAALNGATQATYSVSSTSSANYGLYTVVVSNSAGSVISTAASLYLGPAVSSSGSSAGVVTTVVSPSGGSVVSPIVVSTVSPDDGGPEILTAPVSQSVRAGGSVTFAVSASGVGVLTYQWYFNAAVITGAVGSSLTISNAQNPNIGTYSVAITGATGTVTCAAALAVTPALAPPAVTTQPAPQSVGSGASATFSVAASGDQLTYQWEFNGNAITGATGSSYTVGSAQQSSAGSYTVTVSNAVGAVTSNAAQLSVSPASSGGGGGGGAPSYPFYGFIALLVAVRLGQTRAKSA